MAKLRMKKIGNLKDEVKLLDEEVLKLGKSMEKADAFLIEDIHYFAVYEKYYYRANNYVTLSIHLYKQEDTIWIEAISAGGGGGILKISWGSEQDFLTDFEELMQKQGYHE